jgi:hypothetical protein
MPFSVLPGPDAGLRCEAIGPLCGTDIDKGVTGGDWGVRE